MNKFITALKKIRLSQFLIAFLAGVLLLVNTACSNQGANPEVQSRSRQEAPAGKLIETGKNNPRPEVPDDAVTNTFKPGTMNEFSDVDPRAKGVEAAAANKAAALKENAERNVIDQTGDLGENTKRILDKKGENVQDLGKNVKQSTENATNKAASATEDFVKGTKQAAEDVKDSTLNTTRNLTRSANQAAEDAKQTVKANTPDTRQLTRSASQAAKDATEDTKAAGNNLIDNAQKALQNTNEFVQSKLNQAAQCTQNTVDKAARNTLTKAGNAINDAVDID